MELKKFLTLIVYILILFVLIENIFTLPISCINFENKTDIEIPNIVSRKEWQARPPVARELMDETPKPYVVVHHGGIIQYCYDVKTCSAIVREYQNMHLDERGFYDIGYSFVIGEDGNAYEGRGWDYVGAHAPGYNTQSIGICIIGDFSNRLPNNAALKTLKALIKYGVSLGKISQDYHVIGHRQTKNTLCPGDKLYEYIQKFAQWTANPVPKNSTTS